MNRTDKYYKGSFWNTARYKKSTNKIAGKLYNTDKYYKGSFWNTARYKKSTNKIAVKLYVYILI